MKSSPFLSLHTKDAIKGLIVAILTSVLTGVYDIIASGAMPTAAQWKTIGIAGLTAGVGYVMKNWLTNSSDQFAKPEPKNPA